MPRKKRLFVTRFELDQRISALAKIKWGSDWTWYRLAKEMNMPWHSVTRSLRADSDTPTREPSLKVLKAAARALGCSVGFLVDREVKKG